MTDKKDLTKYTMYFTCESGYSSAVDVDSTSLQEAVNTFYDNLDNYFDDEEFFSLDNVEYTKNGKLHDVNDIGLLST